MGSTAEYRSAFVKRLNQACDENPLVPDRNRGRQNYIAEKMNVAPEAVSKWFNGVSMPRHDKMKELANLLDVDQSWLAFGIKPEMDRGTRKLHANRQDGAVMLVWGLITLAGGHCGEPSERDPRRAYVDFYATFRGVVYPIHVGLARELSKDQFEVVLPREYQDVRSIAVVPVGASKYHFLDLPLTIVEKHKSRKGGSIAITINRVDRDRYVTGSSHWPRIRSFEEEMA